MADIAIFRINYKSDFILTLNSDAGWMTPFCAKFWTGAPSQAYFVGFDGTTYTHCAPVDGEPTKLRVQFDDHHLPIGDLKFQIGYHFTVADFPTNVEDEVLNQASVIVEVDDAPAQVMLDLNGETAPEIEFSLPAYANEAQRIANEEQRITAESQRISNEEARIAAEQARQLNEQQRINNEAQRVQEFAHLKTESQDATSAANAAAALAAAKAQLAADKAVLAQAAATLAGEKAQLAADKAALADAAATLANQKAALARQKAEYANTQGTYAKAQGDYAKAQGDYAKAQGDTAQADHNRSEADHTTAAADHATAVEDHRTAGFDHTLSNADHVLAGQDHTTAAADHETAASDHTLAASDHETAASDHTMAASDHETAAADHTRAESDHAAVEVYVDSLGAFDISAYHATGGVLAKYANLSAALGTNGVNIPEGLRKGGMSVKFVQSSDNKYVQYRYMETDASAVAKFTNTENWQKFPDIDSVEAPFVYAITDNEGKVLSYIDREGYTHDKREQGEVISDYMEKTDGYVNMQFGVSDGEEKLIFGVKNDGSLFSPWLEKQLKEAGQKASKVQNYTDSVKARLPMPHNIASLNIIAKNITEVSSPLTYPWTIEYLDEYGNYFMKDAKAKHQGRSSMSYPKHNWTVDLLNSDGSGFKVKFGDWCEFDSFHLKAFYIDVFVGQCDVAYKLIEEVYQSAPQEYKRPWGYMINEDVAITGASGNFDDDFNYVEPLAHPDGFPVKVFVNGEFYGVYAFNIKKDRNNYKMKKNDTSHILLDGVTDNRYMFTTNVGWSGLEVRNPKGLKDVNGNDYKEGAELSSTDPKSAAVKASIERLNGFITAIKADTTKAVFEQYWNVPLMIDHYLVSQVIGNIDDVGTHTNSVWATYEGNIWSPTLYDCDSIFGQNVFGTDLSNPPASLYSSTDVNQPYYYLVNLYRTELEERYRELRDNGIFTAEHITNMLQEWVDRIGKDNISLNLGKWPEIPTYRASGTYTNNPTTGGCYNSVSRVKKWLDASFTIVDNLLNYNN